MSWDVVFRLIDLGMATGEKIMELYRRAKERAALENRDITLADIDALEAELQPPITPIIEG